MNNTQPIFTEKARCQDCYRCVRNCPVKAIKIENGVASVIVELCIHCGKCVEACPAGAKKVRDDIAKVETLLASDREVIASIAPSYKSEFSEFDDDAFVGCLRSLGFSAVSETALGAEEVSGHVLAMMESQQPKHTVMISTACPVVVNYIKIYYPKLTHYLTPLLSPMMTHCKQLKKQYTNAAVVFFGPCIGKKDELVQFPELCDGVLTFDNLRTMLAAKGIEPTKEYFLNGSFIPKKASEGIMYPVDGGMIAGVRRNSRVIDQQMMHFSGMNEVTSVLESLLTDEIDKTIFLELLACSGGCINGPITDRNKGIFSKRLAVVKEVSKLEWNTPIITIKNVSAVFEPMPLVRPPVSVDALEHVLKSTGKHSVTDEINCNGCGYGNCRDFARAVIDGRAETAMCVTYMRQLALKKANKLISAMPSGVVIVDNDMNIIECNARFADLGGNDSNMIYQVLPGMHGAALEKVLPVTHLFRHVIENGEDISGKIIKVNERMLRCSLFTIEPGLIVGGIFSDITDPEIKKEEIINRARSVIRNNLATVQKIAYLLGENASETELALSGIIDCFDPVKKDE